MSDKAVRDFSLPSTGGGTFRLSAHRGKKLVLYFYPKDNTPGCSREASDFRDLHPEFVRAGAEVFGVSRDTIAAHERFKAKLGLPFELLSDTDETASREFGVLKWKTLYGRKVRGIERSTFVFDASGVLAREWRAVKVPGHAREVLEFVKAL
jgi:peroxiredoxin Q/BCP